MRLFFANATLLWGVHATLVGDWKAIIGKERKESLGATDNKSKGIEREDKVRTVRVDSFCEKRILLQASQ